MRDATPTIQKDGAFYDHCRGQHQPEAAIWRDYRRTPYRIPDQVKPWLLDQGSLSRHLQRVSGGHFSVRLLRQTWSSARRDERQLLGLQLRERAQVRETVLQVRGEPWVFARSVIPARSSTGVNRQLRRLGERSLGSWLFQAHDLRRSRFQVARLSPEHSPVPAALQQGQSLWGRRSRFEVNGSPLLVCEIFLPAFTAWPCRPKQRLQS